MNTHKFMLPSGLPCEVTELLGKHQRILTEQKNKKNGENLNEMIADVIVSIGNQSKAEIRAELGENWIKHLLSCDRKKILVEVRQFSTDFDPTFKFTYKYESERDGLQKEEELEAGLEEGFKETPVKMEVEGELIDAKYERYSDIIKKFTIDLPKSKKTVEFTMLDGFGEELALKTAKNSRSSHTAIHIRKPVYLDKTANDVVPIQLNLDSLPLTDIEALRTKIKSVEGQVDTELIFPHPEAELKSRNEQSIIIDLTNELAFFFPSEAI